MAMVTEHLGFGITCTLSFEPPYPFARRMSTLDHLTGGRVGWNIVTGYLNSAAKGVGGSDQTRHDTRYDIADEYMEVVYKLWEGSWEDDAVVRDRAAGIFTDPDKVHEFSHDGNVLPRRRGASVRAFAAAHAGALPGGRFDDGAGVRRDARRMRVHRGTHQARAGAARRRPAACVREHGRAAADVLIFTLDDRDRRAHRRRGAKRNTPSTAATSATRARSR